MIGFSTLWRRCGLRAFALTGVSTLVYCALFLALAGISFLAFGDSANSIEFGSVGPLVLPGLWIGSVAGYGWRALRPMRQVLRLGVTRRAVSAFLISSALVFAILIGLATTSVHLIDRAVLSSRHLGGPTLDFVFRDGAKAAAIAAVLATGAAALWAIAERWVWGPVLLALAFVAAMIGLGSPPARVPSTPSGGTPSVIIDLSTVSPFLIAAIICAVSSLVCWLVLRRMPVA